MQATAAGPQPASPPHHGRLVHEPQGALVIRFLKLMQVAKPAARDVSLVRVSKNKFRAQRQARQAAADEAPAAASALGEALAVQPHYDPAARKQSVVQLILLDVLVLRAGLDGGWTAARWCAQQQR